MTLAAILLPQVPIVMSDVLLSHLGEPKVAFTPTGVIIRPMSGPRTYRPIDFVQKTVLLDERRAAFTGAGKVTTLKSLAADLRDRIRKGMGRDGLEAWLASRESICGSSTSAMVAWVDNDGYSVGRVGGGIRALTTEGGQHVFCCGSGVDWLRRNLIRKSAALETIGEFSFAELVRLTAIAQTAQHLAQERFLGVRDAFGAGFQITYYDGASFVPVPQVTYLVFMVEHDRDGPARMGLAGSIIVQRSNGQRLAFEQWIPEREEFATSSEEATLQTRVRFIEKVVPPLLHARSEPFPRPPLSTGDYIAAQVVHVHDGRLVGLSSFQMAGDPRLSGVLLEGDAKKGIRLAIQQSIFQIWKNKFQPIDMVGKPHAAIDADAG